MNTEMSEKVRSFETGVVQTLSWMIMIFTSFCPHHVKSVHVPTMQMTLWIVGLVEINKTTQLPISRGYSEVAIVRQSATMTCI